MNKDALEQLLQDVAAGTVSAAEARERLALAPLAHLAEATVDLNRSLRQGTPEVIYGAGKTAEQILAIGRSLIAAGEVDILVTRVSPEKVELLKAAEIPLLYDALARLAILAPTVNRPAKGLIAVVSAGTSDQYAAEEAALVAEVLGNRVLRIRDVGVAGLHRLLERLPELRQARVVICVAGMEGALPSVIGGLVDSPIIAVPTSVGYGASFGGVAALLAMLNSCASGISVVNIDNGFGAAFQASRINQLGPCTEVQ